MEGNYRWTVCLCYRLLGFTGDRIYDLVSCSATLFEVRGQIAKDLMLIFSPVMRGGNHCRNQCDGIDYTCPSPIAFKIYWLQRVYPGRTPTQTYYYTVLSQSYLAHRATASLGLVPHRHLNLNLLLGRKVTYQYVNGVNFWVHVTVRYFTIIALINARILPVVSKNPYSEIL
jgi:hypothetical protein